MHAAPKGITKYHSPPMAFFERVRRSKTKGVPMMRGYLNRPRVLALLAAAAVALGGAGALAKDVKVKLTGAEETPPVTTTAAGSGTIAIATDGAVTGSIKTTGVDGIAAHIHVGAPGQAGPPIITLEKGADGVWSVPAGSKLTDDQLASFKAGNLYVNVHSAEHKPGEIRAQLKP
jgi:hypothetical protein